MKQVKKDEKIHVMKHTMIFNNQPADMSDYICFSGYYEKREDFGIHSKLSVL